MLREVPGVDVVREATSASEALGEVAKAAPDFVVLDLHMPGGHGLDLLSGLASRAARPQVLIVLTNDPSEYHRRESLARGADYFLDKSRDVDRVLDILADAIRVETAKNAHGVP